MSKPPASKPTTQTGGSKDRFWIPRFWDGMHLTGWITLLTRNRFAIAPRCVAMALIIAGLGPVHFFLWALQHGLYGRKLAKTKIREHPIFILGHWRSGTTLLHELLVLDPRHTYPDTYACFAPNHFLLSNHFIRPCLGLLLPSRRPIDNMAAGWSRPQEDEFALCNMGLPSPYLTIVFPNHPPQNQEYLDMKGVGPESLKRWQEGLNWFLRCITLQTPKRIVLKSPAHTSRIKVLLDLFPDARFVHIVRDPYVIFPSTMNLWKRLYRDQGLQIPTYEGLEEHVFQSMLRMYEAFDEQRPLISAGRFSEVRYEDLVRDPLGQMQRIYDDLELDDFQSVRPALEAHLAGLKDYKTNRYEITPQMREEISRRWGTVIEKYGYGE